MTRIALITALSLSLFGLVACGTSTTDRALSGSGIGAAAGAVGGVLVGAPVQGALIGGAIGAGVGALTDKNQPAFPM